MNCPKCQNTLRIASSKFESDIGSTDVFSVQLLVCVNPDCANKEINLDHPTRVVETVRNKVN
jgi:hypothetical protein